MVMCDTILEYFIMVGPKCIILALKDRVKL
jgi:hypothetical protein